MDLSLVSPAVPHEAAAYFGGKSKHGCDLQSINAHVWGDGFIPCRNIWNDTWDFPNTFTGAQGLCRA